MLSNRSFFHFETRKRLTLMRGETLTAGLKSLVMMIYGRYVARQEFCTKRNGIGDRGTIRRLVSDETLKNQKISTILQFDKTR